ncbi:carboxymuconolactone decarboxylase family protein [Falsiroseomonas selenitidurans]|uniref:Carboxymuconolactone decarboxylase family protein n=1 Tax=Falsiroseomonas selenitidurans TaxID=2716335 RepID=A0ABX1E243_9PROT|nr:carboxymuconolactone decarboxylase family protein [Falsiroseomonas selenitidurans]NKC31128.1 carboxymuconolactone decarboxylase family protein [Falsiroseomonas selenitidurans]
MSRLTIPAREAAPAASQPLLDAVEKSLGSVPNLFRLVGQSPAALSGLLGLNGALSKALDARTRERIALAVAQVNGCDYCLSAHSYLALNLAKLDEAEIALNRRGHSADPRADAAVVFAAKVATARGQVSDADLAAVKLAGYTEAQIIEIVGLVVVNVFTNFINNVAETEIDFPVVRAAEAA